MLQSSPYTSSKASSISPANSTTLDNAYPPCPHSLTPSPKVRTSFMDGPYLLRHMSIQGGQSPSSWEIVPPESKTRGEQFFRTRGTSADPWPPYDTKNYFRKLKINISNWILFFTLGIIGQFKAKKGKSWKNSTWKMLSFIHKGSWTYPRIIFITRNPKEEARRVDFASKNSWIGKR